jgi:hypothetical protein
MNIEFSSDDRVALESLRHKHAHIENAVVSLAEGLDTALFLWGEGGTGKSYTCNQKLNDLQASYILHNSRLTGRGLVDALEAAPTAIHWIEDAETLLSDKNAIGVLRSACWSQSKAKPKVRQITWTAHRVHKRFDFTGAILVVSNASLVDSVPEIRALRTRVKVLRIDVSPFEVLALTKAICQQGYQLGPYRMTPSECWTVTKFVMEHVALLQHSLDLRLVLGGFHDFLLSRDHPAATLAWQEILKARMAGSPTAYKTPRQKAVEEKLLALEIYGKPLTQKEKIAEWTGKTGKNRASFYNALGR